MSNALAYCAVTFNYDAKSFTVLAEEVFCFLLNLSLLVFGLNLGDLTRPLFNRLSYLTGSLGSTVL